MLSHVLALWPFKAATTLLSVLLSSDALMITLQCLMSNFEAIELKPQKFSLKRKCFSDLGF